MRTKICFSNIWIFVYHHILSCMRFRYNFCCVSILRNLRIHKIFLFIEERCCFKLQRVNKPCKIFVKICHCLLVADFPVLLAAACLDRHLTSPLTGESESHYNEQTTLDLRCPSRHMVRIVDVLYGHAESPAASRTTHDDDARFQLSPPRCHYVSGDCVTHLPSHELDVPCIGDSRCPITVPAGDHGRPIPGCNRTTTFVQASYQCIPGKIMSSNRVDALRVDI
jgi:hypothetical protein